MASLRPNSCRLPPLYIYCSTKSSHEDDCISKIHSILGSLRYSVIACVVLFSKDLLGNMEVWKYENVESGLRYDVKMKQ